MKKATLSLLAIGLGWLIQAQVEELPNTGLADADTFRILYEHWRAKAGPGDRPLVIPLSQFGALSRGAGRGAGSVTVNLRAGTVSAQVTGLPAGAWDVYLIDNRPGPGHSTMADAADVAVNVGRLGGALSLPALPASFQPDRAMVVAAGTLPSAGFALAGSASVYERLARGWLRLNETDERGVGMGVELNTLIAKGRGLFRRETFQGNGRTCATCHVEANNFTIDPAFVRGLDASDPLFVNERSAALARDFERGELLRSHGLILANADGFEDLRNKYVMRAVPSLQALGTQSTAPEPVFFADFTANGQENSEPERTGWGNDNLPVREFAVGAIGQHMTRTLGRRAGVDYRLPTDEELDAIAVYMLAIGRGEDFDLRRLRVHLSEAAQGQRLFMDTGAIGEPGHKNCNACHFNGGGTSGFALNGDAPGFSPILDQVARGFNASTGSNVNGLPQSLALGIPRDGGYGRLPLPTMGFGNLGEIPGVGVVPIEEFTSNSVVESADTAPYFHNHAVATLEEAVAFYGTRAYAAVESIGDEMAGPVPVRISSNANDGEVLAISSFLRVLNALENIRSSVSAAERARRARTLDDVREIAGLGLEETNDGLDVLSAGSMERNGEYRLLQARGLLRAARDGWERARRANDRASADGGLVTALNALRAAREMLAEPDTLPASFRR